MELNMDLLEARNILHKHGYKLIDESYHYLYEAEEENEEQEDFVANDDSQAEEKSEKQDSDGDMSVQLKHIVDKLRNTKNYEQYVSVLKGMKPAQTQLLHDLIGDGEFSKDVTVQKGSIPVKLLHPTQQEIDVNNSLYYPLNKNPKGPPSVVDILNGGQSFTINKSPIIVYKHDGKYYIIDGHHRWSQIFLLNPKAKMNIILFSAPKGTDETPVEMLRDFQLVIKAITGKVKVSDANSKYNVYKMSDEAIKNFVLNVTTDEALDLWKSFKGQENATKETIADYIVKTSNQLKENNGPAEGAPRRNVMPQTDDKTLAVAAKGMMDV